MVTDNVFSSTLYRSKSDSGLDAAIFPGLRDQFIHINKIKGVVHNVKARAHALPKPVEMARCESCQQKIINASAEALVKGAAEEFVRNDAESLRSRKSSSESIPPSYESSPLSYASTSSSYENIDSLSNENLSSSSSSDFLRPNPSRIELELDGKPVAMTYFRPTAICYDEPVVIQCIEESVGKKTKAVQSDPSTHERAPSSTLSSSFLRTIDGQQVFVIPDGVPLILAGDKSYVCRSVSDFCQEPSVSELNVCLPKDDGNRRVPEAVIKFIERGKNRVQAWREYLRYKLHEIAALIGISEEEYRVMEADPEKLSLEDERRLAEALMLSLRKMKIE